MKSHFIHGELDMIAQRYPTLQGLLRKRLHPDKPKQVGKVWIETIQARNLDPDHFSNVCYAYAMAEKKLPEPQDQLLFAIIEEVTELMDKDRRQLRNYEIQAMGRRTNAMDFVRSDRTGRIAVWLGEQVKAGRLSREENDKRMDELLAWDKQKEVTEPPEWVK